MSVGARIGERTGKAETLALVSRLVRTSVDNRNNVTDTYQEGICTYTTVVVSHCQGHREGLAVSVGVRRGQRSGVCAAVTEIPDIRVGVGARIGERTGKVETLARVSRLVRTSTDCRYHIGHRHRERGRTCGTIVVRHRKCNGERPVVSVGVNRDQRSGFGAAVTEIPAKRVGIARIPVNINAFIT